MPRARNPVHERGKAVQGNQGSWLPARLKQSRDPVMIGTENFVFTTCATGCAERHIGRNRGLVGHGGDRGRMAGCAIAVDDEAGIDLLDQIGAQKRLQLHTDAMNTDIPGNMALPIGLWHAQTPQRTRHSASRMVAHQNEGRSGRRLRYPVGWRVLRAEKRSKLAHELRAPC